MEAYITAQVNVNYLTFWFRVSGSNPELQAIRARLLEGILDRLDLTPRRQGEFLEARQAKYPPEQMADCLTRLAGFLCISINWTSRCFQIVC